MENGCQLSVVVTSRNDGHGGKMLERTRLFGDSLINQANRFGISGELIIVEWNPPDGPRLSEVLHFQNRSEHFDIRFIEVPESIHVGLRNADVIPLFQMIAKNVGIRRARGKFVLATNPDLLFTDELMSKLASDLDPRVMYRLDRTDVEANIPLNATMQEQLSWCESHVLRIHTRWGTFHSRTALYRLWHLAGRVSGDERPRLHARSEALSARWQRAKRRLRLRANRLRSWITKPKLPRYQIRRLLRWSTVRSLLRFPWLAARYLAQAAAHANYQLLRPILAQPKLHTNGCGDFTLLSREAWHTLRGYPELPIWSMHLDSLFCYTADAAGYREEVLPGPARMYHLEHASSWVVMRFSRSCGAACWQLHARCCTTPSPGGMGMRSSPSRSRARVRC
jgi:hypothetical protein